MKATCAKCQHVFFVHAASASKGGAYNRCPRCGTPFTAATGTIQSAERSWDTSGTHPIVHGAYAGAVAGIVGGILALILTFLGFGSFLLGVPISGATAAMTLLMVFLRIFSLGLLVGMSLAWIREKTKWEVRGILGGIIGPLVGGLLGLIYEIGADRVTGGDFNSAVIFGSVVGWVIKAAILTLLAILAKRLLFPSAEEGSFLSPVTISQQGIVGILCCIVVLTIGLEIKEGRLSPFARQQALHELSTEGIVLKNLEESVNTEGDLVITGAVENTTKTDKAGWIAVAELFMENGQVLRHATLINGLQIFNINDLEVLRKRGVPLSPPNLSEVKGYYVLKAGTSVPFKVRFYGPLEKYKECSVTLKDLDKNTIHEILSEGLKDFQTIHGK